MSKTEEKEVKVEKMVLNIEGEKVPLTLDQARKLHDILHEMFGREVVIKEHHHHDWWYRPYYWGTVTTPDWRTNLVYCSNNTLQVTV